MNRSPHRLLSALILIISTYPIHAATNLVFKKDPLQSVHWSPYILVTGVLLAVLYFLAKKSKMRPKTQSRCKVIEQSILNHKTNIYILDYEGQRFLLADNQNALAIHPLAEVTITL